MRTSQKLIIRTWSNRANFTKVGRMLEKSQPTNPSWTTTSHPLEFPSSGLHQNSSFGPGPIVRISPKFIIRTWSNRANFNKAHHSDLVRCSSELHKSSSFGLGPIVRISPKFILRTWSNRVNFTKAHRSDLVQSCELHKSWPHA